MKLWQLAPGLMSRTNNNDILPIQPRCVESSLLLLHPEPGSKRTLHNLPDCILERIVVLDTTAADKRSLRATCRCFRRLLDNAMKTAVLKAKGDFTPHFQSWLQDRPLSTLCLDLKFCSSSAKVQNQLLASVPRTLTALSLKHVTISSLKSLASMSNLTGLCIQDCSPPQPDNPWELPSEHLPGIEHLKGLTRLQVIGRLGSHLGSVSHLAPTLRHMELWDCSRVQDVSSLTNLQVLKLSGTLPRSCFQVLGSTPLRHIQWKPEADWGLQINDAASWAACPTTLQSISLWGSYPQILPDVLPSHVTHLQLLRTDVPAINQAAAALPHLQRIDMSMHVWGLSTPADKALQALTSFTQLKVLKLWVGVQEGYGSLSRLCVWNKAMVLAKVPAITDAVGRGVAVTVVKEEHELYLYPSRWPTRCQWAVGDDHRALVTNNDTSCICCLQ